MSGIENNILGTIIFFIRATSLNKGRFQMFFFSIHFYLKIITLSEFETLGVMGENNSGIIIYYSSVFNNECIINMKQAPVLLLTRQSVLYLREVQ